MRIFVHQCDVLTQQADVLICPANVFLNMSGGVNGEILLRGGNAVQAELHETLRRSGKVWLPAGSVVTTGPGSLKFKAIVHAIAIDGLYGSNVVLVRQTIQTALAKVSGLRATTVAMPALATGYGPLTMTDFAKALAQATRYDFPPVRDLHIVVRSAESVEALLDVLGTNATLSAPSSL